MGALLSLSLSKSLEKTLQVPTQKAYFWTDIMNTLWWLKNKLYLEDLYWQQICKNPTKGNSGTVKAC